MGGGAGNDWRVQLADYASSRLKDEEMMRCQADLRAARAEIERLNNVVRQAQSRAADDIRREQVHCAYRTWMYMRCICSHAPATPLCGGRAHQQSKFVSVCLCERV